MHLAVAQPKCDSYDRYDSGVIPGSGRMLTSDDFTGFYGNESFMNLTYFEAIVAGTTTGGAGCGETTNARSTAAANTTGPRIYLYYLVLVCTCYTLSIRIRCVL